MKWTMRAGSLAALAIVFTACGGSSASSSASGGGSSGSSGAAVGGASLGTAATTVDATDSLTFGPTAVSVKAGDIVQWKNTGSMPHNIVFATASDADDTAFGIGDTWQVKFTQAGTYQYQCTLHPGMTGTVTVQ